MYRVFVRSWWKENPSYPRGLEPCMGKKHILQSQILNRAEAQNICREYNRTHAPGRLSRKAEFEET